MGRRRTGAQPVYLARCHPDYAWEETTFVLLCHLVLGSTRMEYSPHWRRGQWRDQGGTAGGNSPTLHGLGRAYVRTFVEQLLHPDAFFARFVRV
jgi:hypothetical protein